MSKEQRVDLPGEVDGPEPGDHQLRQHHAGHAHHLPVRHHGGLDPYHVLGEKINYLLGFQLGIFSIIGPITPLTFFFLFVFLMIYIWPDCVLCLSWDQLQEVV